jgi:DNA (cytosine-5)-methyltransferase 1
MAESSACAERGRRGLKKKNEVRFIDLFCGIGGFRLAFEQAAEECGIKHRAVFSCDIDDACARAYAANYGDVPVGDITQVANSDIPEHDVLLAGFPCQSFSIIGNLQGFLDSTRGTLFFEIARILKHKRPRAFILENVKQLAGHNKGKTMATIISTLREIGYVCDYRVLNALDFGLPQKRERVFIVGYLGVGEHQWPSTKIPMVPLSKVLEPDYDIPEKFWASGYIKDKRKAAHTPAVSPSIWHENKAGHISSYPYSCALRANASYNYLLVNGERRLTPREALRLQGFPDLFKIVCTDEQTKKQAGNAVPVPVAQAVIRPVVERLAASVFGAQQARPEKRRAVYGTEAKA